jgi:replicative DNA helicase
VSAEPLPESEAVSFHGEAESEDVSAFELRPAFDGDHGPTVSDPLPIAAPAALGRVRSYDELLEDYARERSAPEWQPVHLGFGSIDAEIRGVSPGQVLGVAARTGGGKTWLLETIEGNFTAREDAGSLALSLEMPGAEWAERAVAISSDVAPEVVETWARKGELGKHVRSFLERYSRALVVEDAVRLAELPAVIAEARTRLPVPLRLVLVDYLALLGVDGRDAYERASTLGRGLKAVAKQEKVPIVVAMQLSRAGGDGSEPVSLTMLRDSGVLEESLDFLLGCWRPGKAANLSPPDALDLADVLRVALLKNRKGRDGRIVDLRFRPESRRLYEEADPFVETR